MTTQKLRLFTARDLPDIPGLARLDADTRLRMRAVAEVLPFKVNGYVLDQLIDWDRVPDDPMFQLTFPQPGMLEPADLARMVDLLHRGADKATVGAAARHIQGRMNPHPAGQLQLNVPTLDGAPLSGMQHKYRETVLFFPVQGQTCHTYCSYCFRWAQFVGLEELKFASRHADLLVEYLRRHPEVTNVLFTGGDPMVMNARVLGNYLRPLLRAGLDHITTIRIGTKSLAYWPQRFVTDPDADDVLRLFEEVRAAGKHLAVMAHYSHPRELSTEIAQAALRRVQSTGAVIRCQAPVIRHVNDDAQVWSEMWRWQTQLGLVPYYMFVERDTGPKRYFEVPLARAHQLFRDALADVSGLARTVRGPSMSATPGKVLIDGVVELGGRTLFALKMLQGRDPRWAGKLFFAEYDRHATWLDQLRPAFGEAQFFFEEPIRGMGLEAGRRAWADLPPVKRTPLRPPPPPPEPGPDWGHMDLGAVEA